MMDDQDKGQFNNDLQFYTHPEIIETEKVSYKEETQPQHELESDNTKVYTNLENGNEVIVTEEAPEILVYEKNEHGAFDNCGEYIQICDSNNVYEEVSITESKDEEDVIVNVEEDGVSDFREEDIEVCEKPIQKNTQPKDYSNVLLEDWEVDVPQSQEGVNNTEVVVASEELAVANTQEVDENDTEIENIPKEDVEIPPKEVTSEAPNEKPKEPQVTPRTDFLKIPKSITKNEIVKILDESTDRVVRPIATGKDLFFSIELTKRLNQKLTPKTPILKLGEKSASADSCNNNNSIDDAQKIVDILEGEDSSTAKENGNNMKISKMNQKTSKNEGKDSPKTPRRTSGKRFKLIDKELERSLALRQLREEFPSTRKQLRMKKLNHIPFLASTEVQKALTLPEVTTALKPGPPKRRPCYLPENMRNDDTDKPGKVKKPKGKDGAPLRDLNDKPDAVDLDLGPPKSISSPVVKTYSVKRKSTDTENEIKSTIAAVNKALSESVGEKTELKPKKQKTATEEKKKVKNKILVKRKKSKPETGGDKKRNSELEKLLGDEGAVRMLYDTQRAETNVNASKKSKIKTTVGLKNDLVLKKKLVKNAVMRLSGVGNEGVSLRGKRRFVKTKPKETKQEEPLFASTPNIVLYKPKKKQRAEASRILYRHSSSESFDSTDGYGKTSVDADALTSSKAEAVVNGEKGENLSSTGVSSKGKFESPIRKVKRLKSIKVLQKMKMKKEAKQGKLKALKRLSTESGSVTVPKLNLSNVPVRKSSRPRVVSKKYSIWSSTSMDSLSVESLGLKKQKKASLELGKKLNCKELNVLQYDRLVQVVLTPAATLLKNSLSCEVLQELKRVFNHLSEDDSCAAVLLTSQGKTFCQGVDINQIITSNSSEKKNGVSKLVTAVREFVQCLSVFKKPLIAGVQGAAVGLGVTLLPYCDLVLSSDKASYYTPYAKIGQAPEGAPTHTFPRISRHLVSELLFRSVKMTATDAFKYGLVTQLIPEERFEEDVMMVAKSLVAQSSQVFRKFLMCPNQPQIVCEAFISLTEVVAVYFDSINAEDKHVLFEEVYDLKEDKWFYIKTPTENKSISNKKEGKAVDAETLVKSMWLLIECQKQMPEKWMRFNERRLREIIFSFIHLLSSTTSSEFQDKLSGLELLSILNPTARWCGQWCHTATGRFLLCSALRKYRSFFIHVVEVILINMKVKKQSQVQSEVTFKKIPSEKSIKKSVKINSSKAEKENQQIESLAVERNKCIRSAPTMLVQKNSSRNTGMKKKEQFLQLLLGNIPPVVVSQAVFLHCLSLVVCLIQHRSGRSLFPIHTALKNRLLSVQDLTLSIIEYIEYYEIKEGNLNSTSEYRRKIIDLVNILKQQKSIIVSSRMSADRFPSSHR